MKGTIFHIAEELAITPAEGLCITNRWWSVHPEKGLAFYFQPFGYAASEEPSPQCNQDRATAEHLQKRLHPDHLVKHMPLVFLEHAESEMRRLRKDLRERARQEGERDG